MARSTSSLRSSVPLSDMAPHPFVPWHSVRRSASLRGGGVTSPRRAGGPTCSACDDRGMAAPADWTEVAQRCWMRRYPEWDVTVGVVAGSDGLAVIDTRATAGQGRSLRDDVRRLSSSPIRWVVNTHQHFDHTFGNIAFDDAEIWAHENAAMGLDAHARWVREQRRENLANGEEAPPITTDVLQDVLDTRLRPADRTFSSVAVLDLGDRGAELVYCGRGHTDGDLVVRVPDVDVVFAGDLVEQSGRPSYGPDCFPLEWPAALEMVLGVVTDGGTVLPGHGSPVDREFVQRQHGDVAVVANTIGQLASSGVPLAAALDEGDWPWERAHLEHAVRRGYEHAAGPSDQLRIIS
ncbi:MAG: MBL fold metallo-hydrolase [Propionibacteriales bacterium]|nr:MBL fold metallo-hydrolase [Propionibacteriales bacterium]